MNNNGLKNASIKTALSATDEPVLIVEYGTRIVLACNLAAEQLFGHPEEDLIGGVTEHLHADPSGFRLFGEESHRSLDEQGIFIRRIPMRRRDRSIFMADVRVLVLKANHGPGIAVGVINPVAEIDFSEETDSETSEGMSHRPILERICHQCDWVLGEIWRLDPDGHLKVEASWSTLPSRTRTFQRMSAMLGLELGEGAPGRSWLSGTPEWVEDIQKNPRRVFRRSFAAKAANLHSVLAVPVIHDGEVQAVAAFFSDKPRIKDAEVISKIDEALSTLALFPQSVPSNALSGDARKLRASDLKNATIHLICDPQTMRIWDVVQADHARWAYGKITNFDGMLLDQEITQGRQLCDTSKILPDTIYHPTYTPYRYIDESGDPHWGVLRTEIKFWHCGRALEATFFDRPSEGTIRNRDNKALLAILTPRERQVLRQSLLGLTSKQVARKLKISHRTVESHRASIMQKLDVRSFSQVSAIFGSTFGR